MKSQSRYASRCCYGLALAVVLAVSSQASAQLVVSQVYGDAVAAGPNGDYVEIFNRSCADVNLDGYSVQIATATGTAWSVVALPDFTLQPGMYYLIKLTNTVAGTIILSPDLIANPAITLLSLTSGKVAIVRGDAPLPVIACPAADLVVDFVRYANVAPVVCTETSSKDVRVGAAAVAGTGIIRADNGCTDINANNTDFAVTSVGPVLRNSGDAPNPCVGVSPDFGACVLPAGNCIIMTPGECDTSLGAFNQECDSCPQPGACCLTDGTCSIQIQTACEANALFYRWTAGASCSPNLCVGRCCEPDGDCTLSVAPSCVFPNRFGGDGSNCSDVREYGNPNPPTILIPTTGTGGTGLGQCVPSIINVPDGFIIQDVDVKIKIEHTFRADLVMCLSGPGGSPTVRLTVGTTCVSGGSCVGEDNFNVVFNDEGAAIVCASANLTNLASTPDQVIPNQALDAFDGLSAAGDWTLNIFDDAGGDSGTLLAWSLLLDNGQACVGACCTGLSCSRQSSQACAQAGGVYQGDTTSCTPSPCAPNGACCLSAGCSIQAQADCIAAGGVYGGNTSTCASPAPCQAPCCKSNGTCDLRTIASCNGLTGAVPGVLGTSCAPAPCAPTGACCAEDGTCTTPTTQVGCTASGGVRWTAGAACTPNLCQGRCCSADGSVCSIKFPPGTPGGNSCNAPEVYGGDGTTCTGINPCQGRCCAPDGNCTTTLATGCPAPSVFAGLGTDCSNPDLCKGRCCQTEGNCSLESQNGCVAPAIFGGLGTNCNNAVCTGRCCLANGTCSVDTIAGCSANGGAITVGLDCTSTTVLNFDNIGLAIPEGPGGATVTNVQVVGGLPTPLTDVDVDFKIDHTFFADLIISVEHNGTVVALTDGTAACFGDNPDVVLDDEGTGGAMDTIACPSGFVPTSPPNYTPLAPLMAFDGMDPNGAWTISIKDDANLDTGTLRRWSLHITTDAPVCQVVACTCRGDLNGDTLVNGKDVKQFAQCVAAGGAGCPCGDMNNSGSANSADVPAFVTAVMTGNCGP